MTKEEIETARLRAYAEEILAWKTRYDTAGERISLLESTVRDLREALVRAIRALRFADTPEARVVSFAELREQLETAIAKSLEVVP